MGHEAHHQPQGANAAPLGLFGFGMTTILLNIHNAGFFPLDAMVMAMGIFFGGIAQLIAGIMEYRRGNSFATLAFVAYGSFWLTLVLIWNAKLVGLPPTESTSLGCYLAIWGLFTLVLFFAALKGPVIGKLVFGSLVVLFWLLALSCFTGSESLHVLAGYEGILCGLFAFYEGSALTLNERYGRAVLPL